MANIQECECKELILVSTILEVILICACVATVGLILTVWFWDVLNNDDEHYFDDEV